MKKRLTLLFVLLIGISLLSIFLLGGCSSGNSDENGNKANKRDAKAEADVKQVVEGFGKALQNVSLQGPAEDVKQSMQENYGEYVAPDLLERWYAEPLKAPGRLTSSPWPDRIEIQKVERLAEEAYKVDGEIIEITSADKENEVAVKREITLVVENMEGKWLIITTNIRDAEEE